MPNSQNPYQPPVLPQEPAQSTMPDWFRDWANDLREEVLEARDPIQGGTAQWWRDLPEGLRCYILSNIEPDEWDRYMSANWIALGADIRREVGKQCRAIRRALEPCRWY